MTRRRTVSPYSCPCGKRGYWTRQDARTVVKEMRRQGALREAARVSTYRCELSPDFWHVGHTTRHNLAPDMNDPRLRWVDTQRLNPEENR